MEIHFFKEAILFLKLEILFSMKIILSTGASHPFSYSAARYNSGLLVRGCAPNRNQLTCASKAAPQLRNAHF